jgi:hypothetical protein
LPLFSWPAIRAISSGHEEKARPVRSHRVAPPRYQLRIIRARVRSLQCVICFRQS